ncbi:MAG TPA: FAD:protein FMN transferase [Solirubrobacteraceae bacterium]|jgi:thiamine biosynthesis lipoprotein|nr:FAD:protein FMN transferase [Solirubrobacteraceae bacterium]
MSETHDITFHSMGSDVRLLIGPPLLRTASPPAQAAWRERAYIEDFAARLSRFRSDSELSALNRDPRTRVPASPLLRTAVRAGIWAAQRSEGLVDPTLTGALERAGYATSLDRVPPASLEQALAAAPPRRPARPHPEQLWRRISVDDPSAAVRRAVGVTFDTGGTGKGLCADAVAHRLAGYTRFVVDCGGDLAIGGVGAQLEPYEVEVEHPLTGEAVRTLRIAAGGVATSGLNVRVWRDSRGRFAHHLLDPASGLPAWTGLVGATALAPSALEAETLSKMALLLGPLGARRVLAEHGGLIVHDDGEVEGIGPLDRPRGALQLAGRAA